MRLAFLATALCLAVPAQADDTTMIVLDASGSMWGQIDGTNKIVIARDVVRQTLGATAPDKSVGLMAYGHSRKGDCSDIAVLVPPAPRQAGAVITAVDGINPKGKTPLTDAVRQAAQALRHDENPATVVLVTDGVETCDADPCALARSLEKTGVDFTAHVVGFGLSASDGAAVSCVAELTGGRYFKADTAGELANALSNLVVTSLTPDVVARDRPQVEPKYNLQINVHLTPDSPPLQDGQIDKLALDLIRQSDGSSRRVGYTPALALKVEAGDYVLRASYTGGQVEVPVTVEQFDVSHATVSINAGVVDFRAVPLGQGVIAPDAISWRVTDAETGQRQDRYMQDLQSVFAPGTYDVMVILGRKDTVSPPPVRIEVKPGDVAHGKIPLPHGSLRIETVSETGSPLPDSHTRFGLWTTKDDGSRDRFVTGDAGGGRAVYALPGEYLLVAEDWGIAGGGKRQLTAPFVIEPGVATARRVVMPADPNVPMSMAAPEQP